MIRVEVYRNQNSFKKIQVFGHAMYDVSGKDIVCSAVSTCVITTVNGIAEIDPDYLLVHQTENKIVLDIQKENEICSKLLFNMIQILEELEEQYPKNITVTSKEGEL